MWNYKKFVMSRATILHICIYVHTVSTNIKYIVLTYNMHVPALYNDAYSTFSVAIPVP
jgi:hypothetical protein